MRVEATEVYALGGALSLGTIAALFIVAYHTRQRRWSAEFAFAYALAALVYALDPITRPTDAYANPYTMISALSVGTLLLDGMINHVGISGAVARRLRMAAVAAAAGSLAALWSGVLTRLAAAAVVSGYVLAVALIAASAAHRERRSGHGLVFLSMMTYPPIVFAAWRGWIPISMVRYAIIFPLAISGMTLLTTGLVRAQRRADNELRRAEQAEIALRGLNESLERRVQQRTAELHDVVAGLEAFNRSVSHDLRGPLAGIVGASRLASEALQRGDAATASRMLSMITSQAESSIELVVALLALARVADAPFVRRRIPLEGVVQQALAQLSLADPAAPHVPVKVNTPMPEVDADPELLRQVYVNLIGNARKFVRQAQAPVVEVGVLGADGARTFYVRDNGIGFDMERAQGLFEPFHRLHDRTFAGHGVGLSIVKRIVERHGGRVWAESMPGCGATFYFTLGDSPSGPVDPARRDPLPSARACVPADRAVAKAGCRGGRAEGLCHAQGGAAPAC